MSLKNFFSINLYNLALQTQKANGALKPSMKLKEFIRLTAKELVLKKIFNRDSGKETLFGKKIFFSDYQHLKSLFEEIFLEEQYYFRAATKNPFIVDCGSNIGASILYFKLLYPDARILAFEPDHDSFSLLQQFVRENKLQQVTIQPKALSDKKGELDLFSMPDDPASLSMSVYQDAFDSIKYKSKAAKVEATILSEYITDRVDLLKIDIEGAEYEVLEELDRAGKFPQIDQIILEGHVFNKAMSLKVITLLKILEKNNFSFKISSPNGLPAKVNVNHWRYMVYAEKNTNGTARG